MFVVFDPFVSTLFFYLDIIYQYMNSKLHIHFTIHHYNYSFQVSKLSDYIQRFALNECGQFNTSLSKDKYFDLYNIAIHLLRAIESLDPERTRRRHVCIGYDICLSYVCSCTDTVHIAFNHLLGYLITA